MGYPVAYRKGASVPRAQPAGFQEPASKPPAPFRPTPWSPVGPPGNDNVKRLLAGARVAGFFARFHPATRLLLSALELPLTVIGNEYDYGAWTVTCAAGPKENEIYLGGPTSCGGLFVTGGPAYHRIVTGGWYDTLVETWGTQNPMPGFSNVSWSAWRPIWWADPTPPAPQDDKAIEFLPGFIGAPEWFPQIAPEYTPILRPAPEGVPIPWRQIPLRPAPEFDPLTPLTPQPQAFAPSPRVPVIPWTPWYDDWVNDRPRRGGTTRPPGPVPPHHVEDMPVVVPPVGWPDLDIAPQTAPHGNGPPFVRFEPAGKMPSRNKQGKEKKLRAAGLWTLVTAARIQSNAMDYKDYVNALYQALPKGCRDKASGRTGAYAGRTSGQKRTWNSGGPARGNDRFVPVHRKLVAVARCIDRMDVYKAAANLAKELMEDIIGAGGDALRTGAARKSGLNKVQFDVRPPTVSNQG